MVNNILNNLPVWDKKIGKWLEPLGAGINLCLVAVILVTVWAIFSWKNEYKALWLAFLVSP
jgi:hypothetical protein